MHIELWTNYTVISSQGWAEWILTCTWQMTWAKLWRSKMPQHDMWAALCFIFFFFFFFFYHQPHNPPWTLLLNKLMQGWWVLFPKGTFICTHLCSCPESSDLELKHQSDTDCPLVKCLNSDHFFFFLSYLQFSDQFVLSSFTVFNEYSW